MVGEDRESRTVGVDRKGGRGNCWSGNKLIKLMMKCERSWQTLWMRVSGRNVERAKAKHTVIRKTRKRLKSTC